MRRLGSRYSTVQSVETAQSIKERQSWTGRQFSVHFKALPLTTYMSGCWNTVCLARDARVLHRDYGY
jgi:hypothetical protein